METRQDIIKKAKRKDDCKKASKIFLTLCMLDVVWQLVNVYQVRYQLTSPLIPESTIWEISRQFVFQATVSAAVSVPGLIFYFFEKYVLVIVIVTLALIAGRFIYA